MSTGMSEVYTWLDALPADADQRTARRRARCGVSHHPAAAVESAGAAGVRQRVAVVPHARRLLRGASRARVLRADAAARVRQLRRVLARLDQRAAAGVALGDGRGGRLAADVVEPARVPV